MLPTPDYLPPYPTWSTKPIPRMKFIELLPFKNKDGSMTSPCFLAVHTISRVTTVHDVLRLRVSCLIACHDNGEYQSGESAEQFMTRLAENGGADVIFYIPEEEEEK
jgi:hypothetical protein